MKTLCFLLLALLSSNVYCDYKAYSIDNKSSITVYDETIGIEKNSKNIVLFYSRMEDDKGSNKVKQNRYNCSSKKTQIRDEDLQQFTKPMWLPPDSVGRKAGEYVCNLANAKTYNK